MGAHRRRPCLRCFWRKKSRTARAADAYLFFPLAVKDLLGTILILIFSFPRHLSLSRPYLDVIPEKTCTGSFVESRAWSGFYLGPSWPYLKMLDVNEIVAGSQIIICDNSVFFNLQVTDYFWDDVKVVGEVRLYLNI